MKTGQRAKEGRTRGQEYSDAWRNKLQGRNSRIGKKSITREWRARGEARNGRRKDGDETEAGEGRYGRAYMYI